MIEEDACDLQWLADKADGCCVLTVDTLRPIRNEGAERLILYKFVIYGYRLG